MKNHKRITPWLVLGGLMLLAGVASADFNVRDHGTHYQNSSSGLKTNSTGDLKMDDADRDRDFPLITNLFSGQQLLAGAMYQMQVGIPTMQYTRAAIMLTWACALADTDSVRIAVRVYGATSSTSSNWHLWTPIATFTPTDTCESVQTAGDSTGFGRCLRPFSFWVGRKPTSRFPNTVNPGAVTTVHGALTDVFDGTLATATAKMVRIRKIPGSILRYGSANGVMLNLTDNTGAPCPFPYIRLEVYNLTNGTTLTNIEANVWPRVQ
jgi:hypothetical protein